MYLKYVRTFEIDMEGSMQMCHLFSVVAFEILYDTLLLLLCILSC